MKTENILTGIKLALGTIAGIGISAICTTFAGGLTGKMKPLEKICVGFASAVVGGMVGEKAAEYIDNQVDSIAGIATAVKGVVDQAKTNNQEA